MKIKILVLIFFMFICLNCIANIFVHEIKKGDTLYSISKKHSIPLDVLMELNDITDPNIIFADEILKLRKEPNDAIIEKYLHLSQDINKFLEYIFNSTLFKIHHNLDVPERYEFMISLYNMLLEINEVEYADYIKSQIPKFDQFNNIKENDNKSYNYEKIKRNNVLSNEFLKNKEYNSSIKLIIENTKNNLGNYCLLYYIIEGLLNFVSHVKNENIIIDFSLSDKLFNFLIVYYYY